MKIMKNGIEQTENGQWEKRRPPHNKEAETDAFEHFGVVPLRKRRKASLPYSYTWGCNKITKFWKYSLRKCFPQTFQELTSETQFEEDFLEDG